MTALENRRDQPSLDELKASRIKILENMISIREYRARLLEADAAVDVARQKRIAFADHHAKLVDDWARGGCIGARPEPNHNEHDELEARLHRCVISAQTNTAALANLATREAEERKAFAGVDRPIRIAAVEVLCASLDEIADETIALREKLATNEKSLLAAHCLIRKIGEVVDRDGQPKVDSTFVMAANAIRGITLPSREQWVAIDAEATKYWTNELAELCK